MLRLKWVGVFFLTGSLSFGALAACPKVEPEAHPFWKRKEKIFRGLKEDRQIAVAVNARKPKVVEGVKEELYLQGAGHVRAPLDFTFARAQSYEAFPKMTSMITHSHYDAKNQLLDMTMEAFGYRAHLKMKVEPGPTEGPQRDIRFCVVEGVFANTGVVFRLDELEKGRTQISLTALKGFDKLPMPRFFVEFGLEIALKVAAGKMRSFVEEAFEREKKEQKKG